MLGSLLVTMANGSKAAASAQNGLQRWTDLLSDSTKEAIMARQYGNSPEAMQKFKAAHPEKAAQMFPEGPPDASKFTTDGFLVCSIKII